jgi:hypothetical protein
VAPAPDAPALDAPLPPGASVTRSGSATSPHASSSRPNPACASFLNTITFEEGASFAKLVAEAGKI